MGRAQDRSSIPFVYVESIEDQEGHKRLFGRNLVVCHHDKYESDIVYCDEMMPGTGTNITISVDVFFWLYNSFRAASSTETSSYRCASLITW